VHVDLLRVSSDIISGLWTMMSTGDPRAAIYRLISKYLLAWVALARKAIPTCRAKNIWRGVPLGICRRMLEVCEGYAGPCGGSGDIPIFPASDENTSGSHPWAPSFEAYLCSPQACTPRTTIETRLNHPKPNSLTSKPCIR